MKRDNYWLKRLTKKIWGRYFSDTEMQNDVRVTFGKRARRQLGSISHRGDHTLITINGLFKEEAIPTFLIEATIAHELIHYATGFQSPLKQRYRHPHQGGVIKKEMIERDLEGLFKHQKTWLKDNWPAVLKKHFKR